MDKVFEMYWKCITYARLKYEAAEEYLDEQIKNKEDIEDYECKNQFINFQM